MQVYKDGQIIYNSIDNTGASDDAALGARYAMGRLNTLDGRFDGYYTKTEILDLLTGMAKTYIVAELPVAPDANTYYMVGDDSDGYVLHYYDHDLEHALVGSYELDFSSVSPQRATLPPAGSQYEGKVYQYIGTTQARYTRGKWYECRNQALYAWLHTTNAWVMYTYNEAPANNEYIYNEDGIPYMYPVRSVSGNTLTDMNGDTWTRNSGADSSAYMWFDLANGALSSVWNTDLATGKVVTTTARGKLTTTNVNTGEVNYLSGVTGNIQTQLNNRQLKMTAAAVDTVADGTVLSGNDLVNAKSYNTTAKILFNYIASKIYPVGAVYISTSSTSPATLFGGTWERMKDRFLLATGDTYATVNATGGAKEVTLKRSDLPKVSVTTSSDGAKTTDLSGVKAFTYKGGGEANKWGLDYGTKELYESKSYGSTEATASAHTHSFNLNGNVTQTKVATMPPYVTVYMWKRTA